MNLQRPQAREMHQSIQVNCHENVLARTVVPGITVQLAEYWLDDSQNPHIYSSSSAYKLALVGINLANLDPRTGYTKNDLYVSTRSPLMYDPPGLERHSYVLDDSQTVYRPRRNRAVSCHFDPELFRQQTGLDDDLSPAYLKACLTINRPLLMISMEQLFKEMSAPGFAHDLLVDGIGRILMVETARYFRSLSLSPLSEHRAKRLSRRHLLRIREHLEETGGRGATIRDLAQTCGLSAEYLRRAFRQTTGRSLLAYVEAVRLSRAKALLDERRLPIKQIAHHVGFANSNSFTVAFRRATGETPGSYQQRRAVPKSI